MASSPKTSKMKGTPFGSPKGIPLSDLPMKAGGEKTPKGLLGPSRTPKTRPIQSFFQKGSRLR